MTSCGHDVGRIGHPREYADLVAFLSSPLAAYINGATMNIDGGYYYDR